VVAWRRLDDFDQSRPFGPWLRGIARNLVAAHGRTSKRRRCSAAVVDQIEARLDQISARHGDTWQEKLAFLEDCVDALPEHYRRVVRLRYFQEQAIQQVSQTLQLSAVAVKKRLQRARSLVMQCINRKLPAWEHGR
ncbi:MAG: sigma-70 family RNA polymerase sigma factor, partial [Planctomycetota bacterium]